MVLLVQRFAKLHSKLENYHHHHHHYDHHQAEADNISAPLRVFRSEISSLVTKLSLNWKQEDGLENLSLEWIQKCFHVLPMINKAFGKLVMEIDYHMSKWKAKTSEEYFKYSLNLLDFLNSFSSSMSYLAQAKLSLSHTLSLVKTSPSLARERLKAIEFKNPRKEFKFQEYKEAEEERSCLDKEWVILQALMELRSVGFWVCSVLFGGLCGDAKGFLEMRKLAGNLSNPALIKLDSIILEVVMKKGCVLKEVKELNDAAASLAAAIASGNSRNAAEELQTRLGMIGKLLDSLTKEVDCLFNEVLVGRNDLLNGIRSTKP
ncbi:hypothetical protein JCGZ_16893 [Jatropha curcas]|uniref:Uncharacterized protein n=1 Tax=Jatropha curcas TaxID=180498 RepID=A0A067L558_JATCU|nr:hypothetical protein JCGZ_16893 [Jatropha curcas]